MPSDAPCGLSTGLTFRALLIGGASAALLAIWTCHSAYIAHASVLTITHLPIAALFPLIVTVFLINGLLRKFAPSRILTAPEVDDSQEFFSYRFELSLTSYNQLAGWINSNRTFSSAEFMALGWGAGLAWLLIVAHHRLPWWPLHPIGFGVAQAFGTTFVVFSVFLSWLIKTLLLKTGGVRLYRQGQPFFLGMLVGYVLGVALSYGVDVIWFPNNGHVLHSW